MTAYNAPAVADAVIAYQKPITLQQGRALRDNPKAMGEADASVPSNLLPTVLLGTLTTTSGTTQTLSSLVLTPYKFLRIVVNKVSFTTNSPLQFGGKVASNTPTAGVPGADSFMGTIILDLSSSIFSAQIGVGNLTLGDSYAGAAWGGFTAYTNASTSIVFSGGTFDAGSILVYGEK